MSVLSLSITTSKLLLRKFWWETIWHIIFYIQDFLLCSLRMWREKFLPTLILINHTYQFKTNHASKINAPFWKLLFVPVQFVPLRWWETMDIFGVGGLVHVCMELEHICNETWYGCKLLFKGTNYSVKMNVLHIIYTHLPLLIRTTKQMKLSTERSRHLLRKHP